MRLPGSRPVGARTRSRGRRPTRSVSRPSSTAAATAPSTFDAGGVVAPHRVDGDRHERRPGPPSSPVARCTSRPLVRAAGGADAVRHLLDAAVRAVRRLLRLQEVVRASQVAARLAVSVLWIRHRGSPVSVFRSTSRRVEERRSSLQRSSGGDAGAGRRVPVGPALRTEPPAVVPAERPSSGVSSWSCSSIRGSNGTTRSSYQTTSRSSLGSSSPSSSPFFSARPEGFTAFAPAGFAGFGFSGGFTWAGTKTHETSSFRRKATGARQRAQDTVPANAISAVQDEARARPSQPAREPDRRQREELGPLEPLRSGSRIDEKDRPARRKPLPDSGPWSSVLREEEPRNITWPGCESPSTPGRSRSARRASDVTSRAS